MAKCSFKFQLATSCGILNTDVVKLGKFMLSHRSDYRGEAKLAKLLIDCGKRGAGSLTMADVGMLEMIVSNMETYKAFMVDTRKSVPEFNIGELAEVGNDLIEVAHKFADMDYDDFDKSKKNDDLIKRLRSKLYSRFDKA